MINEIMKTIQRQFQEKRYFETKPYIKGKSLDIGGNQYRKYYSVIADIEPKHTYIKKEDIHNLSFEDNQFDTTSCLACLEHLKNPVRAIEELKRVTKKRIVIIVPNEPIFTLLRLGFWEKEHLWAIRPEALELHLGEPIFSKFINFDREYLAVYEDFKVGCSLFIWKD